MLSNPAYHGLEAWPRRVRPFLHPSFQLEKRPPRRQQMAFALSTPSG